MSDKTLNLAKQSLFDPSGLTEQALNALRDRLLRPSIDDIEFYFQASCSECWRLEALDGHASIIKNIGFTRDAGVGVRVVSGETIGFAYSDDLILPAVESAAEAASSIARYGSTNKNPVNAWNKMSVSHQLYSREDPISGLPITKKLDLLRSLETYIRSLHTNITQLRIQLSGTHDIVLILSGDGSMIADIRPLVRLSISVIVQDQQGRREQGYSGGGAHTNYDYFLQEDRARGWAKEAVLQAVDNLAAEPSPAGSMPVVLGPGWPGVLLHEAVGHGLEADFNRKGSSAFTGRIGERVASSACTVIDDGSLPGCCGSLNVDDEGTATQRTVLIEKGILKSYLYDKLNARLMAAHSTGNGRCESYAYPSIPRMTNTYIHAGNYDPAEIIASVPRGLYAVNFSGGQVDITSGKFVFSACEAYLIIDGKLKQRVKGATLIGHGPEVLMRVSMLGNDLKFDSGMGVCGKEGQQVSVSVGQPTLKVDALTVGGTVQ